MEKNDSNDANQNTDGLCRTYTMGSINQIARIGWNNSPLTPENSIPGFQRAYDEGCRLFLTDVQTTTDGVLVCNHSLGLGSQPDHDKVRHPDGSTLRQEEKNLLITSLSSEELDQYDFGIYRGKKYAGTKILRLEEFFDFCKRVNGVAVVETKSQLSVEDTKQMIGLIKKYDLQHNFILAEDPRFAAVTLPVFADSLPEIRLLMRGGGSTSRYRQALSFLKKYKGVFSESIMSMTVLEDITNEVIEDLESLGISIQFSEITSKEKMDRFLENDLISHIKYFSSSKINIHEYILDNHIQVSSFGDEVFAAIQGLKSVEIPVSVKEMGEWTFAGCADLENVYLQNADLVFDDKAPWSLPIMTYLHVPDSVFSSLRENHRWNDYRLVGSEAISLCVAGDCATFCFPQVCDFSHVEGLKAYVATEYDELNGSVILKEVGNLDAGQGAVLRVESSGFYCVPFAKKAENNDNLLVGVEHEAIAVGEESGNTNFYFAETDDSQPVFIPILSQMTFSAGSAYLSLPAISIDNVTK